MDPERAPTRHLTAPPRVSDVTACRRKSVERTIFPPAVDPADHGIELLAAAVQQVLPRIGQRLTLHLVSQTYRTAAPG